MVLNNNNKKFIKNPVQQLPEGKQKQEYHSSACHYSYGSIIYGACNRGTGDNDIHKRADVPPGRNQVYGIH